MPGNSHVRFGERDGETDLSNEARRTISTLLEANWKMLPTGIAQQLIGCRDVLVRVDL